MKKIFKQFRFRRNSDLEANTSHEGTELTPFNPNGVQNKSRGETSRSENISSTPDSIINSSSKNEIAVKLDIAFTNEQNNVYDTYIESIERIRCEFDIFFENFFEITNDENEPIKVCLLDKLCQTTRHVSQNIQDRLKRTFQLLHKMFQNDLVDSTRDQKHKKTVKKYRHKFRKKILDYSVDPDYSNNFREFLDVSLKISAIHKVMEILHEKANSMPIEKISKLKDILRHLFIKFDHSNFPKKDKEILFKFDEDKHCEASVDVLAEFLLDFNLDNSTIESFIKTIENDSTKRVIEIFYEIETKQEREMKIKESWITKMTNYENMIFDKTVRINEKKIKESCITKIRDYENMTFDKTVRINKKIYNLFQLSCERGYIGLVKVLLNTRFDPNIDNPNPYPKESDSIMAEKPMTLAFLNGHEEVVKILLENKTKFTYNQSILSDILRVLIREKVYSSISVLDEYNKCFDILKKDNRASVSMACTNFLKSAIRMTASTKNCNSYGVILALLKNGASFSIIKGFDEVSNIDYMFQNIPLKAFEEHLNNIIEPLVLKKREVKEIMKDQFKRVEWINSKNNMESKLEIDYSFLEPVIGDNMKTGEKRRDKVLPEIDTVYRMSETNRLKHLMTHPAIQIYLYLKWNHINWLLWSSLILYMFFYAFLSIFVYYDSPGEMENAWCIGVLVVFLVIHMFKELFQFYGNITYYYKNWENWLEMTIFVLTSISLILLSVPDSYYERMHLNAIAMCLASFEFLVLMCKFFVFSIYFEMFVKVISNFFRFILIFFILFLGFGLIFFKLIHDEECESFAFREKKINNSSVFQKLNLDCNETQDSKFFGSIGMSIFKTIVMFIGEIEAGDIYYDNFPFISQVMVSFFVFIVTVVLYNFLNGLAISDIQTIRNDAELMGIEHRVKVLWYVESIFFGLKFKSTENWSESIKTLFKKLFSKFLNIFGYTKLVKCDKTYMLNEVARFRSLAAKNSLFHNIEWKIKVTNPSVYSKLDSKVQDSANFHLVDKDLIDLAEKLIEGRRLPKTAHKKKSQQTNNMEILENKITKIEDQLSKIILILNKMESKDSVKNEEKMLTFERNKFKCTFHYFI